MSLPVPRLLDPEERSRRVHNYEMLCQLLVALTGKDRDHWEAATYSELLSFALEALTAEQLRLSSLASQK